MPVAPYTPASHTTRDWAFSPGVGRADTFGWGLGGAQPLECLEGSERSEAKERLGADPVRIFENGQ
jgi:hypothetical protein